MKKLGMVLLALSLLLTFAACGGEQEDTQGPVSDTNLTPYEEEPVITEMEGELSDLEALLDRPVTLPEAWEVSRCTVIDDYMGQIEFTIGETSYVARYAAGQHENMSAMEKNFATTETVEIDGVSTTLRYTDPEEASGAVNFGVADAYDQAQDVTFCIIQKNFTTVEDLTAAMEALMESVTGGAATEDPATEDPAAEDPAAEEPVTEEPAAGGETAGSSMEEAICFS